MFDPHQIHSIVAKVIFDCFKDGAENRIDPEQAKQVANSIIEMLSEAGLQIVPLVKD